MSIGSSLNYQNGREMLMIVKYIAPIIMYTNSYLQAVDYFLSGS